MNKPRIFDRLVGLETEYAVSFRSRSGTSLPRDSADRSSPTRLEIYERVLVALAKKLPVVRAYHLKEGAFLATGGAVWFEADRLTGNAGLIEGSTPECRTPREVVTFQRAQDRLLEEAARESSYDGEIRLLKNDRDAFGNIYGAQENYDAEFASGIWLAIWRVGLVFLVPLVLFTWLATSLVWLSTLVYEYLAVGVLVPLGDAVLQPGTAARAFLGEDRAEGRPFGAPCPAWLESMLLGIYRAISAPLAGMLFVLLWLTGFRNVRRKLLPFFVSRTILGGVGMLDGDGRFLLADKAPAINGILGYGGFFHGRPLLLLGGFYKTLTMEAMFAPLDFLDLFANRQRLQIGLGDSNLCQAAEWLRVGTTMLVLDCLEAGELPETPRLLKPIQALRTVCADTELVHGFATNQGSCTALQLQRFYCGACRRFLSRRSDAPSEAWQLLKLWEKTLDALETNPRSLVGTLDWVTKRFLLEHAPLNTSWESLKKIDLKYHELSPEGYHRLLSREAGGTTVVEEDDIARAMRLPPADTPASMRGRLIREFLSGDEPLAVNWKMVRIGHGIGARMFRLSEYRHEYAESNLHPRAPQPDDPRPWTDENELDE